MKRKIQKIGIAALSVCILNSCVKDQGNYEYITKNKVTISYPINYINATVDEETVIEPKRIYAVPGKTAADYDHEWYISDKLVSRDSTLVYAGPTPGAHTITYVMRDKETGVGYFAPNNTLNLTSPYAGGYTILYEKNGESELAHMRYRAADTTYIDYVDLYKKKHDGESLGSQPVKLKNYTVSSTWSLVVMQNGGQGNIEMDAASMQKALVTREAFTGGPPANLNAINIGSYSNVHILVNTDGDVYPRFFPQSPVPWSMPWLNIPLSVPKGMKITDLWDSQAQRSTYNFMYDDLNKRLLYLKLDGAIKTYGYLEIDSIPRLNYPAGHVDFNNLGNWQYIYGYSFGDSGNTNGSGNLMQPRILMKDPVSGKLFLQGVQAKALSRVWTFTPSFRMEFGGNHLVNANSKYYGLKTRDILFFSGGPNNNELYFFDIKTQQAPQLFATLSSRITAFAENDLVATSSSAPHELVVGTEGGEAIWFDISDDALFRGAKKEKHRLSNLGKVVDVILRNGNLK